LYGGEFLIPKAPRLSVCIVTVQAKRTFFAVILLPKRDLVHLRFPFVLPFLPFPARTCSVESLHLETTGQQHGETFWPAFTSERRARALSRFMHCELHRLRGARLSNYQGIA
jgi:hypothetical protein